MQHSAAALGTLDFWTAAAAIYLIAMLVTQAVWFMKLRGCIPASQPFGAHVSGPGFVDSRWREEKGRLHFLDQKRKVM